MQRRERFEVFLHVGREHVVGGVLRGPECVAAGAAGWACENFEAGVGGGLEFVCYLDTVLVHLVHLVENSVFLHQSATGM